MYWTDSNALWSNNPKWDTEQWAISLPPIWSLHQYYRVIYMYMQHGIQICCRDYNKMRKYAIPIKPDQFCNSSDIDECLDPTSCDPRISTCLDSRGDYSCPCNWGYKHIVDPLNPKTIPNKKCGGEFWPFLFSELWEISFLSDQTSTNVKTGCSRILRIPRVIKGPHCVLTVSVVSHVNAMKVTKTSPHRHHCNNRVSVSIDLPTYVHPYSIRQTVVKT